MQYKIYLSIYNITAEIFTKRSWLLMTPRKKAFQNNVRKDESAGNLSFLLFPHCFLSFKRQILCFGRLIFLHQTLSIWMGLKILPFGRVNPFTNKPWFFRVCSPSLKKTLWGKEKLLVMSNFSFSHSVFYLFKKFLTFS